MTTIFKDPVCGMTVGENAAKAQVVYKEQTYHFCSLLCKQLFLREPEKYFKAGQKDEADQ